MLNDTVQGLFRRNLTDYQKEINLFVLKVCISGGILGILFFCALKLLGVLDRLEWSGIANFALMSVINLSIPLLFYFLAVRRSDKAILVNIFKYILIACAGVNYLALITFVPYYEMWGCVFLVFFLSSFYLEINSVIYSIILSIVVCLIAILSGNSYFLPQSDTYKELLIRGLGFSFGAICSFITAVLSKKLLMRSSRSEFESSQALHDLEAVVNKAVEISGKLSEAGISISSMAKQQNAASEEIAHKSSDVLAEAAVTANNVDRSAELIQKLVNDIRFNMQKVSEMEASSKRLQEVASEGKSSICDAVEKIEAIKESVSLSADSTGELNQKANEIDVIVAYIRQIADQTNMLSLNASIEAARAGEQGKGFAVVADEIRKLAEQSHQSLKTISGTLGEILTHSKIVNQMMEESVAKVETGVEIVRQSDATYEKIADTLSGTLKLLSEISLLSENQIRESGSLNEFIHEVNNTAQNTSQSIEVVAASTEESFAASEELIRSANLINDLARELLATVKKETGTN